MGKKSCYHNCVFVFVRVYGHVIRAEPVAESDRKEFTIYYVLAFEVKWLLYGYGYGYGYG